MPSMAWILATTMRPSSSMSFASARTMTSYGPVTSSAARTPSMAATCVATCAALPTSVRMRMYAETMHAAFRRSEVGGSGILVAARCHGRRER